MKDSELIDLLLEAVKQDDKRNYFDFVTVRSNSKMSLENIELTSDNFDGNYQRVKCVLDGASLDKRYLRYLRGKMTEGGLFTELAQSFDYYNGAIVGFVASLFALVTYLANGGEQGMWWVKAVLSAIVLGAASFSLYRRAQTNTQNIRLQRLKNYLDIYLDNYDLYQNETAEKILSGDKEESHATSNH